MSFSAMPNGMEVWSSTVSLSAWNKIQKIQKLFICRQLGVNSSTSYVMILETGAWPIKVQAMQKVYKFIGKDKNMSDHRLLKQAWNIGCMIQKTNKRKL